MKSLIQHEASQQGNKTLRQLAGETYQSEKGDCFASALNWAMSLDPKLYSHAKVVHGMVSGQAALEGVTFSHAWGELGGDVVIDNSNGKNLTMRREQYYKLGNIQESTVHKYTPEKAMSKGARSGHYGPWDFAGDTIREGKIPKSKREIGRLKVKLDRSLLSKLKESSLSEGIVTLQSKGGHRGTHGIPGYENPSLHDVLGFLKKEKAIRFTLSDKGKKMLMWSAYGHAIHDDIVDGEDLNSPVTRGVIELPGSLQSRALVTFEGKSRSSLDSNVNGNMTMKRMLRQNPQDILGDDPDIIYRVFEYMK